LFAEVRAAVLYGAPGSEQALVGLRAPEVILAPMLMCDGHCARVVLPRAFGLAGPVTSRFGHRFRICPPVGLQPSLTRLILTRAQALAFRQGLLPRNVSLLLIGHGSTRDPASRRATLWHAAGAREVSVFGSVGVAFLDEEPFLAQALSALKGPTVAVGLFAADGLHASADVPRCIARHAFVSVDYLGAIGEDPGVVDLVLEQVAAVGGTVASKRIMKPRNNQPSHRALRL
jgi:sirohydrochlorin cobaltochelatase